ncbi:MAG TPA: NAD(P)-dependent oxidoreductase [Verrucomicrobiae bacterium]|nr:NAD(P)-dependent oxidoreductase [Verrucomicrobiae bacterium]
MKILLTGATGFIGSNFARAAIARGHQIAGLITPGRAIPADLDANKNFTWLRGTLDDAPWRDIASFHADTCVHSAWITTPGVYLESPENFRFLESSLDFLRRARECNIRHVVGIGTCIEYKISHKKLSEDTTPLAPATTYARCKNDLRIALEAEAAANNDSLCWARVFYPYGPGEHPSRLCSSIIHKLSHKEKIVLKTPGSTKDYIYIDDLATALLAVVEKKLHGPINLGTGIGISVREIARGIAELLDKPALVEELGPPEMDPLGYVVADASKLHALGWRPAFGLERGLKALVLARK